MTIVLSVNVNKVATLRNTRHLNIPSVTRAAELCLKSGAQGITVHPRPDERHIRQTDVMELGRLLKDWPQKEFNVEGNPEHNLLEVIARLRDAELPVHQATFVPDSQDQFTSDHGYDLPHNNAHLHPLIEKAHALKVRVSLFMDANPDLMQEAKQLGVNRIELYTEPFAAAYGTPNQAVQVARLVNAAKAAQALGLGINAGHDLNLANLPGLVKAIPFLAEVSIGHAFMADCLEQGYVACTQAYLKVLLG